MPYLISESILNELHGFKFNIHTSLLPNYRGPDPVIHAIINGSDIGFTIHLIDKGEDTGQIVFQKRYPILDLNSYKLDLFNKWVINNSTIVVSDLLKKSKLDNLLINGISKTKRAKRLTNSYLKTLVLNGKLDINTVRKLLLMRPTLLHELYYSKSDVIRYFRLSIITHSSKSNTKLELPQGTIFINRTLNIKEVMKSVLDLFNLY
jgi:hypothetical protein